jgi:hypothetical protein
MRGSLALGPIAPTLHLSQNAVEQLDIGPRQGTTPPQIAQDQLHACGLCFGKEIAHFIKLFFVMIRQFFNLNRGGKIAAGKFHAHFDHLGGLAAPFIRA